MPAPHQVRDKLRQASRLEIAGFPLSREWRQRNIYDFLRNHQG